MAENLMNCWATSSLNRSLTIGWRVATDLSGELAEDHPADEDGLELLGELLASTGRGLHDDQERLQVRFLFLLDAEGTWGVLSRRKSR